MQIKHSNIKKITLEQISQTLTSLSKLDNIATCSKIIDVDGVPYNGEEKEGSNVDCPPRQIFFLCWHKVAQDTKMGRDDKKKLRTQIDKYSGELLMRVTIKLECFFIFCREVFLITEKNSAGVNKFKACRRLRMPRLLN